MFIITSNNKTPQSLRSHSTSSPVVKQLMTANSGRVWGKTSVKSVLKYYCQSNYRGRGHCPCDVTRTDSSIWERDKDFSRKKHWVDFYHYRVVVYTHCQHTFQLKQLVKVHVALYDPFKKPFNQLFWSMSKIGKMKCPKQHTVHRNATPINWMCGALLPDWKWSFFWGNACTGHPLKGQMGIREFWLDR